MVPYTIIGIYNNVTYCPSKQFSQWMYLLVKEKRTAFLLLQILTQ